MILCVDVDYRRETARAAGALFTAWAAPEPPNAVFTTVTVKESIRQMHGRFRIPTLLKRVDRLCREEFEMQDLKHRTAAPHPLG